MHGTRFVFYEITLVAKVDVEKAQIDSGCDETFHISRISSNQHSDLLTSKDGTGVVLSHYVHISEEDFEKKRYETFTPEGGI